ncbi:hypothetical protein P4S67_09550 [Pseudoalteromonas sp. B137]
MNRSNEKFTGQYVELKSITMHDIPQIHLTYQDERTTEQAKYYYKISIEKLQNIYEERIETSKKGQNIDLLIRKRKNQKVLGTCTFKGIDPKKVLVNSV